MAVTWATFGLLAAVSLGFFALMWTQLGQVNGTIDALGGKVDALGAELRAAIAAQSEDLGRRIEALSAQLGAHISGHRHAG